MALHIRVRRTRPRVYLSEYNLADVRKRIETTHVEEWSQLVVWSRGMAKTPPEYRLRSERIGERARRLAFMYVVRPDDRLVDMAVEIAPALAALRATPSVVEALAQLFDSFHSQLPGELARELTQALARGAEHLFAERVKGQPVLGEARSEAVAPILAAGLSLYLEHPAAQRIIGEAVHASRDLVGTLQYFLEKDGGFPLGWAEGLAHLGQVPKLALLAESGLDQAWPSEVPWLARYVEFLEDGMQDAEGRALGGPRWPGGGRTGHRRADLWRVLAMVAAGHGTPPALRLLRRVRLPGHQDERILYEKRPLAGPPEGEPDRTRARLYRRAGVALFRGGRDAAACTEVVVRCPGALVAGGGRLQAGSFSISWGGRLLSGAAGVPNGLVVDTGARGQAAGGTETEGGEEKGAGKDPLRAPGPAPFPRTRREIGQSEFHTSTIIAFEPDVGRAEKGERGSAHPGAAPDDDRGVFDWLRVDVTPAHRRHATSAFRTFVLMRCLPGGGSSAGAGAPTAALVVADEVDLAAEDTEAASVVSLTARPEARGSVVTAEVGGARLRDFVIEPDPAEIRSEEVAPSTEPGAGSTWRLLVRLNERLGEGLAEPARDDAASGGVGLRRRVCQVFLAESVDADGAPEDAGERDRLCVRLPSTSAPEGALALSVAGRVLVIGGGDTSRVECITAGGADGLAAVGLKASAEARLEVAGQEPVASETSAAGSVYFGVRIPAGTGLVLTAEGEAE